MPTRSSAEPVTRVHHPDRTFQLWEYAVGHSQLLLRSPKGDGCPTRIDVSFKVVEAVHLPTLLHGVTVEPAGPATAERLGVLAAPGRPVFAVTGTGYTGYVAANVMFTVEDDGEYYEGSDVWRLWPPASRTTVPPGDGPPSPAPT